MKETQSFSPKARTFQALQAHLPTSSRQQYPFVDNRSIARFQRAIQRQVLINEQPAIYTDTGDVFVKGQPPVKISEDKAACCTDKYVRRYTDIDEFKKHITGSPVDCGLALKYGKWYRIKNFSDKKFFVLGENHAAFGYRELMQESNQPGKILGEGGSNALMSANPDSKLEISQNSSALYDISSGKKREYVMENPVSKAYFALIMLKGILTKKAHSSIGTSSDESKVAAASWLEKYQSARQDERGRHKESQIPYYKAEGKFVYAEYKTKAEDYDLLTTVKGVLKTLFDQLDKKTSRTGYEPAAWEHLKYFIIDKKHEGWLKSDENDHYEPLLQALKKGSEEETKLWRGSFTPSFPKGLEEADEASTKSAHLSKAYAHREYSMYQSILKAKEDNLFVMAGMGNNHAKHLESALVAKGIPVITLEKFHTSDYTSDAITPIIEQDKDFSTKQTEVHEAYIAYTEELKRIEAEKLKSTEEPIKVTKKLSRSLSVFGIILVVGTFVTIGFLLLLNKKIFDSSSTPK